MRTDRVVEYADSESVTLDAPLSDVLDARVAAASLVRYSFPGRISESGVEGLRITASFAGVPAAAGPVPVLRMDAVEDGWARDLEIQDSQDGIAIGPSAKRLTLTNVRITHTATAEGSAAAVDFSLQGTQVLLDRCSVKGEGTWPVVTETEAIGPLVVLNFAADHGGIASHQPWTTGLLVDGGKFPGGTERKPGVAFPNPATAGKSPEWGAGWSVAWNVNSPCLLVQQPPGAINWCIGCTGTPVSTGGTPNGIFDSPGKAVEPASLYLHQLRDRLGPDAVRNIGY